METIIIPNEITTAQKFNQWIDELWLECDDICVRSKRTGDYITIEDDCWNLDLTKNLGVWYYNLEKEKSGFYKGSFDKSKKNIYVEVTYTTKK